MVVVPTIGEAITIGPKDVHLESPQILVVDPQDNILEMHNGNPSDIADDPSDALIPSAKDAREPNLEAINDDDAISDDDAMVTTSIVVVDHENFHPPTSILPNAGDKDDDDDDDDDEDSEPQLPDARTNLGGDDDDDDEDDDDLCIHVIPRQPAKGIFFRKPAS
ncbi:calsequestrin-1-like [Cynara cardunculus var. scolymus]|uniref:calsequestrin-1-like n=1 Tax=Cynara cardunculus var. scolymus TaxID=59895 RepID=UPI000D626674|nr:calsequestrin-1-like [Cynara cardunculus var. scolymus]